MANIEPTRLLAGSKIPTQGTPGLFLGWNFASVSQFSRKLRSAYSPGFINEQWDKFLTSKMSEEVARQLRRAYRKKLLQQHARGGLYDRIGWRKVKKFRTIVGLVRGRALAYEAATILGGQTVIGGMRPRYDNIPRRMNPLYPSARLAAWLRTVKGLSEDEARKAGYRWARALHQKRSSITVRDFWHDVFLPQPNLRSPIRGVFQPETAARLEQIRDRIKGSLEGKWNEVVAGLRGPRGEKLRSK